MLGSPKYDLSRSEFAHWLWVSLTFAIAAFAAKIIELGNAMEWGDLGALWATLAAAIAWLVKRYVTDTRSPFETPNRMKVFSAVKN